MLMKKLLNFHQNHCTYLYRPLSSCGYLNDLQNFSARTDVEIQLNAAIELLPTLEFGTCFGLRKNKYMFSKVHMRRILNYT